MLKNHVIGDLCDSEPLTPSICKGKQVGFHGLLLQRPRKRSSVGLPYLGNNEGKYLSVFGTVTDKNHMDHIVHGAEAK
jgi:hypothetical protein